MREPSIRSTIRSDPIRSGRPSDRASDQSRTGHQRAIMRSMRARTRLVSPLGSLSCFVTIRESMFIHKIGHRLRLCNYRLITSQAALALHICDSSLPCRDRYRSRSSCSRHSAVCSRGRRGEEGGLYTFTGMMDADGNKSCFRRAIQLFYSGSDPSVSPSLSRSRSERARYNRKDIIFFLLFIIIFFCTSLWLRRLRESSDLIADNNASLSLSLSLFFS